MNKLNRLIKNYVEANRARHALYCKRSKADGRRDPRTGVRAPQGKWTKADAKRLVKARKAKIQASYELRVYAKACGLAVLWGDTNQIVGFQTIERQKKRREDNKKWKARHAKEMMKMTMDKLELI